MRSLICLLAVVFITVQGKPTKRLAGFGISPIGGSAGCVVTGNKLYANGFFLRKLTAAEQQELANYEKEVKKYKEETEKAIEKKRKEFHIHRSGSSDFVATVLVNNDLPKAPERPSFCTASDTTQYYFDGCMVQNNKVYVGQEYARDLTPEEIVELKEFDEKMKDYQRYLTSIINRQSSLFGSMNFWNLFDESPPTTTTVAPHSSTPLTPVEHPVAPRFCTTIY